jgi:hypothetical protein
VRGEALGTTAQVVPLRRQRRLRNWVTPDELARAIAMGASTIRSYVSTGLPANKPPIWHDGAVHKFSETRRAIIADLLIVENALNTPEKRDAMADILATDKPAGWTTFPDFVGERRRPRAA